MPINLTNVRKEIASAAAGAAGLVNVKHYEPDMEHGSPAFWINASPLRLEPSAMGRNRWSVSLTATLHVSDVWDRSAQELADTLVPLVWVAIESDRTLNSTASDVEVREAEWLDLDPGLRVQFVIAVEAP